MKSRNRNISGCVLLQLVAIGARSKESADRFAGTFGIPKAYGTYQEIADDPDIGKCVC